MSEQYKTFIRQFRAVCAAQRMDTKQVAEIMGVHRTTIYNWWTFKTVMDGDSVLRCIKTIMGGCVK
jgi:transposase-like protein